MKKHKEATAQEQSCAVASFLFFRVERTDQNEDSADHIDCRDRSRARRPLGSSGSALVGQGGNCSRIVDDRIDELLSIGNTSMDESERESAYKEIQQRVYDLVPWVPLWVDTIEIGANARIDSMPVTATTAWSIKNVILK